eukprot:139515-Amphidinium_carterae.2
MSGKQKPLCGAGAPPPPPPKDEPEDESSGEDMPDEAQVPHHKDGDTWMTRYGCFQGGRAQGKTKCQACKGSSDMFSAFIFVTGKIQPESREVQWNPAKIDDEDLQKALTRGKDPSDVRQQLLASRASASASGHLGEEVRVKAQPGRTEPLSLALICFNCAEGLLRHMIPDGKSFVTQVEDHPDASGTWQRQPSPWRRSVIADCRDGRLGTQVSTSTCDSMSLRRLWPGFWQNLQAEKTGFPWWETEESPSFTLAQDASAHH